MQSSVYRYSNSEDINGENKLIDDRYRSVSKIAFLPEFPVEASRCIKINLSSNQW